MKNLFERETIDETISRIDKLQPASVRQWGKMDVAQMLAHLNGTMDVASGRLNLPRSLMGRVLGPFFKPVFTNEKPFPRNSPTSPRLVVSDPRDFRREQEQLRLKLRQFQEGGEAKCTRQPHAFIGPVTPQQWARGMYQHLDHYLRQFGV